ncbi:MAG: M1 family aminopeptidase [Planctomycetota bacterium]
MSAARTIEVARLELFRNVKRPLFWILVTVMTLIAWGFSEGNLRISSGDSDVGGVKAWITSEFAVAQWMSMMTALVFSFFIAVSAGMLPIQDKDLKLPELLLSTPLRTGELVLGKALGVLGMILSALVIWILAAILFNHVVPDAASAEFQGPLDLVNYLRPLALMALPYVLLISGVSYLVGQWTQRPILVFVLPIVIVLGSVFFLWVWSPSDISESLNAFLMLIDPAGFRWLSETWLKVDRGVEFYNLSPVGYDAAFLVSRLVIAGIGVGAIGLSARVFRKEMRGERGRRRAPKVAPATLLPTSRAATTLAELGMVTRPIGATRGFLTILRAETRALLTQPGLYLFVPLIILESVLINQTRVGGFDEPLLWTPGTIATGSFNTLSLLVCLLLLFYSVESLDREKRVGLSPLVGASAIRTGSLLAGKALANSVVAAAILVGAFLGGGIVIALQEKVALDIGPFLLVWGLLLIPTFILWTTFISFLQALTRSRYTTYALALAALAWSGYRQQQGDQTWLTNWNLWSALLWSDFGAFELGRRALILNRLLVLALAVVFSWATVQLWARRERDVSQTWHRLHPRRLRRHAVMLLLMLLPVFVTGVLLNAEVDGGFQGEVSEKAQKDYWRKNIATWRDAKDPTPTFVEADVRLEPAESFLKVKGRYTLENHHDVPLRQIALTRGLHWREVGWTLDGEDITPDDRAGLIVFTPEVPLAPGEKVDVGFAFEGHYPGGATKNGGGTGEMILESGVVLTGFSASFLPIIGFSEGIGIDDDNRSDAKDFEPEYFRGITESGFGAARRYHARIRVDVPEAYTANSVGRRVEERIEGGRRIAWFETDFPVMLTNIVAGKWDVRHGVGTAIYHHPDHTYNLDEMIEALDAARKYYSEWFFPYPWAELRVSEFPALAGYAQGFPTNITFSEGIGFLTESDADSSLAFMVTAHESAHQWWGNLVVPAEGPGANLLSEAMAHFSTLLLSEQVRGVGARIDFARKIEDRYGENRVQDSERPLYWIDGSRPGDATCTYDKGGFVMWMLLNHLGREKMLEGLQSFIAHYLDDLDHPVLQDLTRHLRSFAADPAAYDAFVAQWFESVVVAEYRIRDARRSEADGGWLVTAEVSNVGTAHAPIEIAISRGVRFPSDDEDTGPYHEARVTVPLEVGETRTIEIHSDFEPERIVIDPDVRVLQLRRKFAHQDL